VPDQPGVDGLAQRRNVDATGLCTCAVREEPIVRIAPIRKALVALVCAVMILATAAAAQTRRRGNARRNASAAKAAAEKSSATVRAGAARVAAQIKTLTHFVYLYGGIAKGIASVDQAAGQKEASPAAIEQNQRNKAKVRESITSLREALDKLESDFRFNPALAGYYPQLAGVARAGETAENLAAANRFDDAGKTLLQVIDRLADALAAMR
jgi:cell division protein FtsB